MKPYLHYNNIVVIPCKLRLGFHIQTGSELPILLQMLQQTRDMRMFLPNFPLLMINKIDEFKPLMIRSLKCFFKPFSTNPTVGTSQYFSLWGSNLTKRFQKSSFNLHSGQYLGEISKKKFSFKSLIFYL